MEEQKEKIEEKTKDSLVKECPNCGEETLVIVSRCATCQSCGFSLCSM